MSGDFIEVIDTAIHNYAEISCRPNIIRKLGYGISDIMHEAWTAQPISGKTAEALGVAMCHFLEAVDKAFRQGDMS